MNTIQRSFYLEYLHAHGYLESIQENKIMEKDHFVRYFLNFLESYSKSKESGEFPIQYLCNYIKQKNPNIRCLKKPINSFISALQHYSVSSEEVSYYAAILTRKSNCTREIANYLRCRKAVLEFFPGKLCLDDLSLSLSAWTTLLKRLLKDNASNEVLNAFKDKVTQQQEQSILQGGLAERQVNLDHSKSARVKAINKAEKLEINTMQFIKLYLSEFPQPHTSERLVNKKATVEKSSALCTKLPNNTNTISHSVPDLKIKHKEDEGISYNQGKILVEASLDLSSIKLGLSASESFKTDIFGVNFSDMNDMSALLNKINKASSLLGNEQEKKAQIEHFSLSKPAHQDLPVPLQVSNDEMAKSNWGAKNGDIIENLFDKNIERLQSLMSLGNKPDFQKNESMRKSSETLTKRVEVREQENFRKKLNETEEMRKVLFKSVGLYENLVQDHRRVHEFLWEMQKALINVVLPKLGTEEQELFEMLDLEFLEKYLVQRPLDVNSNIIEEVKELNKEISEATKDLDDDAECSESPELKNEPGGLDGFTQNIFLCDPVLLANARTLAGKRVVFERKERNPREKRHKSETRIYFNDESNALTKEEKEIFVQGPERDLIGDRTIDSENLRSFKEKKGSEEKGKNFENNKNGDNKSENKQKTRNIPLNQNSKLRLRQRSQQHIKSLGAALAQHQNLKKQLSSDLPVMDCSVFNGENGSNGGCENRFLSLTSNLLQRNIEKKTEQYKQNKGEKVEKKNGDKKEINRDSRSKCIKFQSFEAPETLYDELFFFKDNIKSDSITDMVMKDSIYSEKKIEKLMEEKRKKTLEDEKIEPIHGEDYLIYDTKDLEEQFIDNVELGADDDVWEQAPERRSEAKYNTKDLFEISKEEKTMIKELEELNKLAGRRKNYERDEREEAIEPDSLECSQIEDNHMGRSAKKIREKGEGSPLLMIEELGDDQRCKTEEIMLEESFGRDSNKANAKEKETGKWKLKTISSVPKFKKNDDECPGIVNNDYDTAKELSNVSQGCWIKQNEGSHSLILKQTSSANGIKSQGNGSIGEDLTFRGDNVSCHKVEQ